MVWEGKDAVLTGRKILGTLVLLREWSVDFQLTVFSFSPLLGATNPLDSAPGTSASITSSRTFEQALTNLLLCTVRGDYAIDVGRNVCHGSDAVESYVFLSPSFATLFPAADQPFQCL